ncbi:MAG: hypothetical protein ACYCOU_15030 [Sulfobacillus sp.]
MKTLNLQPDTWEQDGLERAYAAMGFPFRNGGIDFDVQWCLFWFFHVPHFHWWRSVGCKGARYYACSCGARRMSRCGARRMSRWYSPIDLNWLRGGPWEQQGAVEVPFESRDLVRTFVPARTKEPKINQKGIGIQYATHACW